MPEILKSHTFGSRGRTSSIDWAAWFTEYAGQAVEFTQGTDFDIKPRSFAVAAQEYAKANALGKVRTSVTDTTAVLGFPSAADTKAAKLAAAQAAELAGQEAISV
jgi:hypothetical protein